MRSPYKHPQSYARDLWFAVAKMREAKGDKEGAKRARESARSIPTIKQREHWGWY